MSTVGKLFIIEDNIAEMKPTTMIVVHSPWLDIAENICPNILIIPTFFNPKTTKYIPIEKITIFHGAPLITFLTDTAFDCTAKIRKTLWQDLI